MDPNKQKEEFSIAYVYAVGAVAGYAYYKLNVDQDSVDGGFSTKGAANTPRGPHIEFQLKCSGRDLMSGEAVRYPLKLKNYDELRLAELIVPRILIVTVVPRRVEEWLLQDEHHMTLHHCAYWMSLSGFPIQSNSTSVTVQVPRSQPFTPEALQEIMQRVNDGEPL